MKGGLPIEAFSRVQELFSGVEWVESRDDAAFWFLKQISSNVLQNKFENLILNDVKELSRLQSKVSAQIPLISPVESDEEKEFSLNSDAVSSLDDEKAQPGTNINAMTH